MSRRNRRLYRKISPLRNGKKLGTALSAHPSAVRSEGMGCGRKSAAKNHGLIGWEVGYHGSVKITYQ